MPRHRQEGDVRKGSVTRGVAAPPPCPTFTSLQGCRFLFYPGKPSLDLAGGMSLVLTHQCNRNTEIQRQKYSQTSRSRKQITPQKQEPECIKTNICEVVRSISPVTQTDPPWREASSVASVLKTSSKYEL